MSKTFLIEYASGESSATTGKTWPAESDGTLLTAKWIQCIGAGTVVAVCEGGTVFTRHASGGEVYKGNFTSLTSTTCTYVVMGNGPPPPAIPAYASAASTSALGSVEMSVAPATAATPIAVGTNDTRVTQVEIPIALSNSDGSLAESPVWIPGVACTVTGAYLVSPSAITQSDTNYLTFTLVNNDGAGSAVGNIASKTTKTTGGGNFAALQALTLGSVGNATLTATSVVSFKSVKTSAGQAVTGVALLRITYSVP